MDRKGFRPKKAADMEDIAWSGHCCLVFADCPGIPELIGCMREHQVSVSGLVPSILETLQEQDELPSETFFIMFSSFFDRTSSFFLHVP